jgi:hypothetical protein
VPGNKCTLKNRSASAKVKIGTAGQVHPGLYVKHFSRLSDGKPGEFLSAVWARTKLRGQVHVAYVIARH